MFDDIRCMFHALGWRSGIDLSQACRYVLCLPDEAFFLGCRVLSRRAYLGLRGIIAGAGFDE